MNNRIYREIRWILSDSCPQSRMVRRSKSAPDDMIIIFVRPLWGLNLGRVWAHFWTLIHKYSVAFRFETLTHKPFCILICGQICALNSSIFLLMLVKNANRNPKPTRTIRHYFKDNAASGTNLPSNQKARRFVRSSSVQQRLHVHEGLQFFQALKNHKTTKTHTEFSH